MNVLLLAVPLGILAWMFRSKPASAAELPSAGQAHEPAPTPPQPTTPAPIPPGDLVVPVAPTEEHEQAAEDAADAAQVRDWQRAVSLAIASGDVAQLDQVAREMDVDGLTAQAASVRQVAAYIRAAALAQTQASSPAVTAEQLQAIEPPPLPAPPDPRIALAAKLIEYLKSTKKGSEDKTSVASAQGALGLTADGLYGINTALAVASYGVVPLPPWYLPRANTAAAVDAFDAQMEAYAVADPPRAEQWLLVAKLTSF